jgi:hypothetical protein
VFRPDVMTHRAYLAAMAGLVLTTPFQDNGEVKLFCADPSGRDYLATPEEAAAAACGDCKKLSILAARRAIKAGAKKVELCMTVSNDSEEHVFIRVDGQLRDPMVEAGGPVRQIGDFIAVTVWPVFPER